MRVRRREDRADCAREIAPPHAEVDVEDRALDRALVEQVREHGPFDHEGRHIRLSKEGESALEPPRGPHVKRERRAVVDRLVVGTQPGGGALLLRVVLRHDGTR